MLAAVREDGRPADRSDLLEGDDTAALLDDDGAPDPEKVKAAVSELLARKPQYAKRISGDVGQGTRSGPGDPNEERASYVGCIAGALFRSKYEAGLAAAGFAEVSVAFTHQVGDGLHSAIIKATKPVDTGQPASAATLPSRLPPNGLLLSDLVVGRLISAARLSPSSHGRQGWPRPGVRPWEQGRMADSEGSAATVLDRLVPTFQAVERQSATIAASANQVWAALSQVTVGELGLFRLLMGLRVLPGRLLGRPHARFDADEPLLGWAVRFGFTILGEDARRELVVGAIGQPWRLVGGRGSAVAGGEDFAACDQAGYAKLAASFRLAPGADGRAIPLSTETRVACTDPRSAQRFARYWQLIRPASGAIRRSWLVAIKRRAERHADGDTNHE